MLPSASQIWMAPPERFERIKQQVIDFVDEGNEPTFEEVESIQALQDRIVNTLPTEVLQNIFRHADLDSAISFATVFPEAVPRKVRQQAQAAKAMDHEELITRLVKENRLSLLRRIYKDQDYFLVLDALFESQSYPVLDWFVSKNAPVPIISYLLQIIIDDPTSSKEQVQFVEYITMTYPQYIQGDELFWLRLIDFAVDHHIAQLISWALDHVPLPDEAWEYEDLLHEPV